MNENKHGDTYKVEMLRRMLTHETDAKEVHYGAKLSHSGRGIKPLTIDAGGIDALIRYYENHDTDLDGGAPEFELTKCELETAYRKREHQYRLADAEAQLSAFFGINTEKESPFDEEDSEENSDAFVMKYGYPFVELLDAESRNYALNALVAEFEDAKDCNVAENDTWQAVIAEYFAREREAFASERKAFRELFSKYCRQEINKGHCDSDGCEFCPVNSAYDEIFNRFSDEEESDK